VRCSAGASVDIAKLGNGASLVPRCPLFERAARYARSASFRSPRSPLNEREGSSRSPRVTRWQASLRAAPAWKHPILLTCDNPTPASGPRASSSTRNWGRAWPRTPRALDVRRVGEEIDRGERHRLCRHPSSHSRRWCRRRTPSLASCAWAHRGRRSRCLPAPPARSSSRRRDRSTCRPRPADGVDFTRISLSSACLRERALRGCPLVERRRPGPGLLRTKHGTFQLYGATGSLISAGHFSLR
jgi:hypothetical protein